MPRARHPEPEFEAVLRAAEKQGWRITKRPNGYFKMYCPCDAKHLKTVHLTPNKNYLRDLVAELKRKTCWKGTP